MDYIEAFKNLKTNNKYSRKSPHKAILLLTVIEMYETNVLSENVIPYNDVLKSTFLKVWERSLQDESLFHPEVYLPFWYMQSEDFWHIVPNRGQEDILLLLKDTHVKPSELKLKTCVKYAELDEDLYFLMTLPSSRSSLKRALLETYTKLPEHVIDIMAESTDNSMDHSATALSEYEKILSQKKDVENEGVLETNKELISQFQNLNEELQIVLNIEYYSFLKSHRSERSFFKEIYPSIYVLYDKIANNPIKQGDISPSIAVIIDNFLSDLKISLMSEDGSMDLIDKISEAVGFLRGNNQTDNEIVEIKEEIEESSHTIEKNDDYILSDNRIESNYDDLEIEHVYLGATANNTITNSTEDDIIPERDFAEENRKGKPWTENEEELITLYFNQGKKPSIIAEIVGRTEIAIKSRLAKLGLIEYTYGEEKSSSTSNSEKNFTIKNSASVCSILNELGERVFTTDGKFKYINGKLYRLNLKNECFTIKDMKFDGSVWSRGDKKIVAYPGTELYDVMEHCINICDTVEDIEDNPSFDKCKLKVNGEWYSNYGSLEKPVTEIDKTVGKNEKTSNDDDISSQFSVKIGDRIRIFPSQAIGTVYKLRLDRRGNRIVMVKSTDGSIKEVVDSKYLYEKIYPKEKIQVKTKKVAKTTNVDLTSSRKRRSRAAVGDWIKWIPTGGIGKVIGVKTVGSFIKYILRFKGGSEMEVYDNPSAYNILDKNYDDNDEKDINKKVIEDSTAKVIKIGDWIRVKNFNAKCKIVRIENQGMPFEKLILQFEDGQMDWIINNPDLYTIL